MDAEQRRRLLHDRLAEAQDFFEKPQKSDETDPPNYQREGVVKALDAVLDFLRGEGVGPYLNAPLIALGLAIADIDEGKSNPLLERRKRKGPGAPPIAIERALRLATASVAVTLLMRTGMNEEEALRQVTVRLKREQLSHAQLATWRDKLGSGEKGEIASEFYDGMLRRAAEYENGPSAFAEILLESLNPRP